MAQSRIVGLELRFDEFIAIQIHERDLSVYELLAEASLV